MLLEQVTLFGEKNPKQFWVKAKLDLFFGFFFFNVIGDFWTKL